MIDIHVDDYAAKMSTLFVCVLILLFNIKMRTNENKYFVFYCFFLVMNDNNNSFDDTDFVVFITFKNPTMTFQYCLLLLDHCRLARMNFKVFLLN